MRNESKRLTEIFPLDKRVNRSWKTGSPLQKRIDETTNYIKSLSPKQYQNLVSDTCWNNYPMFSDGGYTLFRGISEQIKRDVFFDESKRNILIKHSQGIFRIVLMESAIGEDLVQAARYGLDSNDSRVKINCIKIVPVKMLERHVKKNGIKTRQVFEAVSKRIGVANLPKEVLEKCMTLKSFERHKSTLHFYILQKQSIEEIQEQLNDDNLKEFLYNYQKVISYKVTPANAAFFLEVFERQNLEKSFSKIFYEKVTGQRDLT